MLDSSGGDHGMYHILGIALAQKFVLGFIVRGIWNILNSGM
jgi:hypothetical protein